MISRGKLISLLSLCLAGTFACGFSSFVFTAKTKTDTDTIQVGVGEVKSDGILSFDTSKGADFSGISAFQYCKDGFVNDGEIDIRQGNVDIYLKLNIPKIKQAYGNPTDSSKYSSLYIASNLTCISSNANFNLMTDTFLDSTKAVSYTYSLMEDYSTSFPLALGNNELDRYTLKSQANGFIERHFTGSNQYFYIHISYSFFMNSTNLDFEKNVFPNLPGCKFSLSLAIGGY